MTLAYLRGGTALLDNESKRRINPSGRTQG